MKSKKINSFIKTNTNLSYEELAEKTGISVDAVRKRWGRLGLPPKKVNAQNSPLTHEMELERDLRLGSLKKDKSRTDKKYRLLQDRLDVKESLLKAVVRMKDGIKPEPIVAKHSDSVGEATAVVVASDWHVEERVVSEKVNFKNAYSLEIAKKRGSEFFVNTLKLVELNRHAVKIDTLVLALLGDFISGNIHESLLSNCALPPVKALIYAQNLLLSGIQYLLDNSDLKLIIPCHVGNHPRITKKVNVDEEQGNSLEYYMYHLLADHFKDEKRIVFLIAESYFSFLDVYSTKLCFHHGHFIKYNSGVGGIYVPMLRGIGQWNLGADIYINGHLHTMTTDQRFISNGSNIGYGCLSVCFKAPYAPPAQQFFLVDKKRGKTVQTPILYSV